VKGISRKGGGEKKREKEALLLALMNLSGMKGRGKESGRIVTDAADTAGNSGKNGGKAGSAASCHSSSGEKGGNPPPKRPPLSPPIFMRSAQGKGKREKEALNNSCLFTYRGGGERGKTESHLRELLCL